jgi:DNA-binding CsgD family transcriptional regulator
MRKNFHKLKTEYHVFLLIFVSFLLTSAAYLSWLYHLLALVGSGAADLLTMVVGYVCQAAGIGATALCCYRRKASITRPVFAAVLLLHAVCLVPALLSHHPAGAISFGLLMNLLCGMIATFYLQELTFATNGSAAAEHRGLIFGAAYCAASVAALLLSLIGGRNALHDDRIIIFYLVLTGLCVWLSHYLYTDREKAASEVPPVSPEKSASPKKSASPEKTASSENSAGSFLILACASVFILSLVKNIGFNFPSSDIIGGVSLELSRIFYAVGLLIAGFVSDRSRRYGAISAFASLIIPFVMLALTGEPVSSMIFWCLDYFIFAYLSVYRILLFSDLAKERNAVWLAGFGLLFGRLGDAAGTGLYMLLQMLLPGNTVVLITAAALLFILSVFVFFQLYQRLYAPTLIRQRSEQEVFELFAKKHDLTGRERTILRMVLEGQSNGQIAEQLFLTESTVKYHIHNLLQKTACKNRRELMQQYTEDRSEG